VRWCRRFSRSGLLDRGIVPIVSSVGFVFSLSLKYSVPETERGRRQGKTKFPETERPNYFGARIQSTLTDW
jgi:hypothetical protein